MRYIILIGLVIITSDSWGQEINDRPKYKTSQYAGFYELGGDIKKGRVGSVLIYSETDSTILFYLDVNRGAPSYNMGQLYGRVLIEKNTGLFNEKILDSENRCKLAFHFKNGTLDISYLDKHEDCGFGFSVWANGEYTRNKSQQPDYFQDQEGNRIFFSKIKPEAYNKE